MSSGIWSRQHERSSFHPSGSEGVDRKIADGMGKCADECQPTMSTLEIYVLTNNPTGATTSNSLVVYDARIWTAVTDDGNRRNFFPAAGDTVSGGVGKGKGLFYFTTIVQQVWESVVVSSISESVLKCSMKTNQRGS